MNVMELVVKGADCSDVKAYGCGVCGKMWSAKCGRSFALETASRCCTPKVCICGAKIVDGSYYTVCNNCLERQRVEKEAVLYEKAEKIKLKDYDGEYLFVDIPHCNDGLVRVDEIGEYMDDMKLRDRPKYAWAAKAYGFGKFDACYLIDSEMEHGDHCEEARDYVVDEDGLQNLLDEWVKKQTLTSYSRDKSIAVMLDCRLEENCK